MTINIRKAVKEDSGNLWILMQKLAIFEDYIDDFAITPAIVQASGFDKTPPDFYCFVAEDQENARLAGMLVYYFLPYTAQNRPAIYMKELYVDEQYRGQKIGERLMQALKAEAKTHHCRQIKWTVAPWNQAGQRFYHTLGAKENREWLNYEWTLD
ncbi:Acetyltransferases [Pasteurella testudinis DSM 23072]|uniref:Acetyltransferases n=1 Tax=Pasteurella testudinis DSM 23072 TaxID=1122938 RepID=A0A1W1UU79_9PAST|nr:GNAT family N-acetyltransferase [Pasteurella testudinis]SMB84586.1 Acetyltransferases [Pasteurella testudinis DSM 23072]SUB52940.1 putative acetyltransferase [Pasteurella testudinis]